MSEEDVDKLNFDKLKINEKKEKEFSLDDAIDMLNKKSPKIVVFSGAGISTSAGIPDFRSADGLYKLIQSTMKLESPMQVFELEYFKKNPEPFFNIAKHFIIQSYKPTLAHCFIKLLDDKGMLLKNFTQNIDGLDYKAGIDESKTIECHGHFRVGHCVDCGKETKFDEMRTQLVETSKLKCTSEECKGLLKPDIVFFGEQLPGSVFANLPMIAEADLALVMGTSLAVSPFNMFVNMTGRNAPFMVLNRDNVSDMLDSNQRKLYMNGSCDDSVRLLCDRLGWTNDLEAIYERVTTAS